MLSLTSDPSPEQDPRARECDQQQENEPCCLENSLSSLLSGWGKLHISAVVEVEAAAERFQNRYFPRFVGGGRTPRIKIVYGMVLSRRLM